MGGTTTNWQRSDRLRLPTGAVDTCVVCLAISAGWASNRRSACVLHNLVHAAYGVAGLVQSGTRNGATAIGMIGLGVPLGRETHTRPTD